MISLGQVIAKDEVGNEFIKEVTVYYREFSLISKGWVIDFGNRASYYLYGGHGLTERILDENSVFYLDAMGRNHKGWGVFITVPQLKELLDKARKEIEDEEQYLWDLSKIPE